MQQPYYSSESGDFTLFKGDCLNVLQQLDVKADMIFADPPYFLSNGGISMQSGKVVCVNKGDWDKGVSEAEMNDFNLRWLNACRKRLTDEGTIWISGTFHNIFSVYAQLLKAGYKVLNVVTWAKTNPPPNISCRYFTHSAEFVIWARKLPKVPHFYNYALMKEINDNKQMRDVWQLPAIARWEKVNGKHPTQKPLSLLGRIVLASTREGGLILDPFSGSSTTGIAANLLQRRFIGVEKETEFLEISRKRGQEISDKAVFQEYRGKIRDIATLRSRGQRTE